MRDAITSQLIGHYFPGFPFMIFQQALEKTLCCLAITPPLKKHVNHLTILIDCTPKVVLLALDLHKYFIDEEGIAVTTMPMLKSSGKLGSKLDAPQANRLIADSNPALGQ